MRMIIITLANWFDQMKKGS